MIDAVFHVRSPQVLLPYQPKPCQALSEHVAFVPVTSESEAHHSVSEKTKAEAPTSRAPAAFRLKNLLHADIFSTRKWESLALTNNRISCREQSVYVGLIESVALSLCGLIGLGFMQ